MMLTFRMIKKGHRRDRVTANAIQAATNPKREYSVGIPRNDLRC